MKHLRQRLPGLALAALLMLMMLVEWLRNTDFLTGAVNDVRQDLLALVLSKSDQVFFVVVLLVYLAVLLWIRTRLKPADLKPPMRMGKGLTWLDALRIGLAAWALIAYVAGWSTAESGSLNALRLGIDQTTNFLVLLTGLVVSYLTEIIIRRDPAAAETVQRRVLLSITGFLAIGSLIQCAPPHVYRYHDVVRATGLWVNPNTYGLLMGTGLMLALGQLPMKRLEWNAPRWTRIVPLVGAALLCGLGLVRSYSRGAWLATAGALAVLAWSHASQPLRRNLIPFALLLLSGFVIAFWQFRYTDNPLARRVFSAANPNDFSWRNRVTVWQGSVQMIRDRPVLGFGWGQTEAAYERSYRARRLDESMAIQLNDYFTLATSAGLPALLLFLGFAVRSLLRPHAMEIRRAPQSASRAATVLLLIGFWFDGGLFRLAIGPLFWVLIEFSRTAPADAPSPPVSSGCHDKLRRWEIAMRALAGFLALAAMIWTAMYLLIPRLAFTEKRAAFARKHLVPPQAIADFDFLAEQPAWREQRLNTLLKHVELANYNRSLAGWELDEGTYRQFVLSPQVDVRFDGDLNWRRPLWEHFYPRIRRQTAIDAAARVALEELRAQIKIQPSAATPIREMWRRQFADEIGFQALCVAVWRSVGIPARLNERKRAEYLMDSQWHAAMEP